MLFSLPLMACQTTGGAVMSSAGQGEAMARAFCLDFQPIRWSKLDTLDTQKQARAHNATGVVLCGWKP